MDDERAETMDWEGPASYKECGGGKKRKQD